VDDVFRGRRLLLIALVVAGCGGARTHEAVGASRSAPAGSTPSAGGVALPRAPSPLPDDYRKTFVKENRARFVSRGHAGGRYEADVFVSPDSQAAWASARSVVPVGAKLVEEHFERGTGKPGPTYMMEKRAAGFDEPHGDWRYLVVGAGGETVKDGPIEACAGCHGDAPREHLFRLDE
jgi:hypothetical protein